MNIYSIGIDPGINGGIAALNNGHIIDLSPMPAGPVALAEHFRYLGFPGVLYNGDITAISIENVHSMPTDGVHSAFVFGQGLGWLEGVMSAMGLPEALKVNSSVWMGSFNLKRNKESEEPKYDFKKRIKQKALDVCPARIWLDKITLKTCDAYLIALYGYEVTKKKQLAEGNEDGHIQDGIKAEKSSMAEPIRVAKASKKKAK